MRVIGRPKQQRTEAPPKTPPQAPQKKPLLVLSGCRWSATGGGQRPVQLSRSLRDLGYPVIYVSHWDRCADVEEGIVSWNLTDLAANMEALRQIPSLLFCGFPAAYEHIIGLRNWLRVLDVCDDWGEFVKAGLLKDIHFNERMARVACLDSHATTYSAQCLGEQSREYGARHTFSLPNAGPDQPLPHDDPPADILRGRGPCCVFVGCLWGNWLDLAAIAKLARDLRPKGGTVNVIGGLDNSASRPEFPQASNIKYHGQKVYPEAMRYVAACDVGLIPFVGEGICRAVDPVKYYDYIAAGLPVVATDVLCELQRRPHVYLTKPDQLARAVTVAARTPVPAAYVTEFCQRESWRARAQALLDIAQKRPEVWQS